MIRPPKHKAARSQAQTRARDASAIPVASEKSTLCVCMVFAACAPQDPLRVQPFLRKIFEGINQLEFQPNYDVTAMISEEGEKV